MTILLELKENLRSFYGKYETYVLPVVKFLLAAAVFFVIDSRLGYMESLHNIALLLILALACSILPSAAMLLVSGVLLALHCYALSLPAGAVMLLLLVLMYILYFRFTPDKAYNALLTPLAFVCGVPYIMPVANGLLGSPAAIFPTVCGTIVYYFLKGISESATAIAEMGEDDTLITKFTEIVNQLFGNKEMYLTIGIFVLVTIFVYIIRKLSVDYAWTIAIITGTLMEFLFFFIGYLTLNLIKDTVALMLSCFITALLLVVVQFFCFNLDYTRTERVQFEDDEYYYYVKAVPKSYVSTREKKIKKISGNAGRRDREDDVTREQLLEDMDIHLKEEKRF